MSQTAMTNNSQPCPRGHRFVRHVRDRRFEIWPFSESAATVLINRNNVVLPLAVFFPTRPISPGRDLQIDVRRRRGDRPVTMTDAGPSDRRHRKIGTLVYSTSRVSRVALTNRSSARHHHTRRHTTNDHPQHFCGGPSHRSGLETRRARATANTREHQY